MIPRLATRLRERWRTRSGRASSNDPQVPERNDRDRIERREQNVKRELAAEFSTEELREFLEGDLRPDQADPVFKEELRDELWQMIQSRYTKGPGPNQR
ncbi:MAG: hypothetical protein GY937_19080 [bacterium]|nr:hypothetical protein [bacterium]